MLASPPGMFESLGQPGGTGPRGPAIETEAHGDGIRPASGEGQGAVAQLHHGRFNPAKTDRHRLGPGPALIAGPALVQLVVAAAAHDGEQAAIGQSDHARLPEAFGRRFALGRQGGGRQIVGRDRGDVLPLLASAVGPGDDHAGIPVANELAVQGGQPTPVTSCDEVAAKGHERRLLDLGAA